MFKNSPPPHFLVLIGFYWTKSNNESNLPNFITVRAFDMNRNWFHGRWSLLGVFSIHLWENKKKEETVLIKKWSLQRLTRIDWLTETVKYFNFNSFCVIFCIYLSLCCSHYHQAKFLFATNCIPFLLIEGSINCEST